MKEAGNVILAEPLRAKDVASAESGSTPGSDHRIVRFIKPIDPFVESAFATAPFVLPRVPVKVSQYWTFQPSAGDAPTFPVVALQLYALPLYEEFRRLLESAAPSRSDALPPNIAAILDHPALQRFVREIRAIYRADT
jgi:adenylate cyclase